MLASIIDRILGLHGAVAIAVVFALPALEASAFVGFVFPGEIAVLLGGVLASQHRVSLPAVLAAGIAGAVAGDTVGYEIGKRWGHRVVHGTLGRVVPRHHLDRAERYLAERGGKAVFFGRFTTALRVLVPGLAGMSGLRYRTFLAYNAAGGILWASGFVLAGYLAGNSWRRVESVAGRASLVLLLLVVLVGAIVLAARWVARNHERLNRLVDRQLARPRIVRVRARYQRQLAFLGRRLQPGTAKGLSLTVGVALLAAAGWVFGALTQDVIAGDEAARFDRPVLDWFVDHREPWLDHTLSALTHLGGAAVVGPAALAVGAVLWWRRHTPRALVFLTVSFAGAEVLYRVVEHLTGRPRPPASLAVGHYTGSAFPSGHATLAATMWIAIALVVAGPNWSWARQVSAVAGGAAVALIVGVTRLYLGAHWLIDVLAGWALGAAWLTTTWLTLPNSEQHRRQVKGPPTPR